METVDRGTQRHTIKRLGLLGGPILAVLVFFMAPESFEAAETGELVPFTLAGRLTLSLLVWMAVWWLTEAIEISATALLPLVVLPLATVDVSSGISASDAMRQAASPYADPMIGLFLGGFLVALSMERWGLHRRIALRALSIVGTSPRAMVGGAMAVTAVMSMWVSNTATAVMMLPIALSIARVAGERNAPGDSDPDRLTRCILLGIAYSASIGGIGTLIGTPPNVVMAAFVRTQMGHEISFVGWMLVGVPLVLILMPLCWLLLTRVIEPLPATPTPNGRAIVRAQLDDLGAPSAGEWITFVVFVTMAIAWMLRPKLVGAQIGGATPLAGLTDTGIAMIAALALFVIPTDRRRRIFALDWQTASKAPWGILVLFGGGLSLADAVRRHGVGELLASSVSGLGAMPEPLIVLSVIVMVVFLTEMTSNTATTATLLPILAALGPALGVDPWLLVVPAAIGASCAFMMPIATPPNAVVFGSGHLTIPQMCRAGFVMNILSIVVLMALTYTLVLWVLVP